MKEYQKDGSAEAAARRESGRMLTGLFREREAAERAYASLHNRGYTRDDINLLMSDETRNKHFRAEDGTAPAPGSKTLEGLGVGSAVGGAVGAIIAAIAAIGTNVVLPGLGLTIAGPLAAAFAGAGAGGLTGGLVGAFVGAGIPEERARLYETGIREGGIVMCVNARSDEDAEFFENEWKRNRGEYIYR